MAKDWAMAYKPWPFLEDLATDLIDATGNYPYPTDVRTKSVKFITVNSERYVKIRYEDYLKYFEEDSSGEDRVWAEYDRTIYINGNACEVGETINMYGREAVSDMSENTDVTPFDTNDPSGDEAVVRRAVAIGLRKIGGLDTEALIEEAEAKEILKTIWDRIAEAMPREVTKTTPRFKKINVVKGTTEEPGPTNIGNFRS